MYQIVYAEDVAADLAALRAYDRGIILDRIEEQLTHQPTEQTRNKKPIIGLEPPWDTESPVWELRVGDFRVFYEVAEQASSVMVRAVRRKPPHLSTEDIL